MRDAALVAVGDAVHDLFKEAFGVPLLEPTVGFGLQVAVQAPARNIIHDENDVLAGVDDLVQADNVLVVDLLHQFDLALHGLATV